MKTINKVQKTVLKSLVLITGFILIGFTVIAQDTRSSFTQNKASNELALATADNRIESQPVSTIYSTYTDVNSFTGQLQTESENRLELEEWMTNEVLFFNMQYPAKKENITISNSGYRELKNPRMALENWMFNPNYWTVKR